MRALRSLSALLSALAFCAGAAGAADVPSIPQPNGDTVLTSKIDAALTDAASYRIAVDGPSGLTLDIREVRPDRVKIASSSGAGRSESIVIGTNMYYRGPAGDWKAYPIPPVRKIRRNRLYMAAPDTLLEPLPDRTQAGASVGAFRSMAMGNGSLPGMMECTYDKDTYRPRTCNVTLQGLPSAVHVTYAGWDDPSNVVEAPSGVTPPVAPAAPAPAASPR